MKMPHMDPVQEVKAGGFRAGLRNPELDRRQVSTSSSSRLSLLFHTALVIPLEV